MRRASISIFNSPGRACLFLLLFLGMAIPRHAHGEGEEEKNATDQPEAQDFRETPYTAYGEFNEDEEEAEVTEFFQKGRFFGVSVGAGFHGVTGNRGLLWQGGFPMVDLRVHAWVSLQVAIQLSFETASHDFTGGTIQNFTDVGWFGLGAHLKYYFDTTDLSAALTFAHPYVSVGAGSFTKTETETGQEQDLQSAFGFGLGGGLEFPVIHRKVYINLEGRYFFTYFEDRGSEKFSSIGVADLSGDFYNLTASVLFTW